jgi:hypothetical protein
VSTLHPRTVARTRSTVALAAAAVILTVVVTAAPVNAASSNPSPAHTVSHQSPSTMALTRDVDDVPCDRHLAADATFHASGASYTTDAQGRPASAAADDLTASVADRGPCQRKVGHMADAPGYDGGHLIAATLHGVDERYDLVPQWASVNRGLYEKMEAGSKRCLKAPGGRIDHYRIRVTYPDAISLAPDLYYTDVAVDTADHPEQTIQLTIPNRALERSEYGKLRGELERGLKAAGCA